MRKSSAPSRSGLNSNIPIATKKVVTPTTCDKEYVNPKAVRSTSSILDLLNKSKNNSVEDSSYSEDSCNENHVLTEKIINTSTSTCASSPQVDKPLNCGKRYFNVVFGKQSKKKHKTWEGDGILEVGEKSLVLKDCEGKILGQGMGKKNAELEEGSRLFVGSKEVEILEIASMSPGVKRTCEKSDDEKLQVARPVKKMKLAPSPLVRKKFEPVTLDFKPLIMPKPDHDHQWNHNSSGAPVTDVTVDSKLARVLRDHQRQGIVFLYRCVMGYHSKTYNGCILADEMGLGKTLQCITLIWTLLRQGPYGNIPVIKRVLIVTPSSLTNNWKQEFSNWLGNEKIKTFVVDQKNKPNDFVNMKNIPVMIISYEMFVRCYDDVANISFDLLICDEGHRLKNNSIRTSMLLNQLPIKRRILLTGTPVQNDLQEFYALVDFVNPGFLGTYTEFKKTYEENILASRQPGVQEDVRMEGELQAQMLMKKTSSFILRRTQELLDKYLPTKHESVVFCKPSPLQTALFHSAISYWEKRGKNKENKHNLEVGSRVDVQHLSVITMLKKICNHPILVYDSEDVQEESLVSFLSSELERLNAETPLIEDATKLTVVAALLQALSNSKEKIVLASYFTQTLDLLSALCDQYGYQHCRLDGTTPAAQRIQIVNNFNSKNSDCFVFLLSARAGGTGLNLIGASRLVLFDSDWNPASDLQTMARIWRDGQKKSVFIYRLLTTGSIEEKIFQRQLSKAGLNEAIVDSKNTSSVKLSEEELKNLFSLNEENISLTHKMLPCPCEGLGDIPQPLIKKQDDLEVRDCQLTVQAKQSNVSSLRMNQLFQWEHHAQPFRPQLLKELKLQEVEDHISFIFYNISDKS